MKKIIFKYPLQIGPDVQRIQIPAGSKVLSVQMQSGQLVMWALVDANAAKVERQVYIVGTGQELGGPGDLDELAALYVGTVQQSWLVWHVFVNDLDIEL